MEGSADKQHGAVSSQGVVVPYSHANDTPKSTTSAPSTAELIASDTTINCKPDGNSLQDRRAGQALVGARNG